MVDVSLEFRLLVVVHVGRRDTLRIISARPAITHERKATKMRDEYRLENGRPNPHLRKLGARGRKEMIAWWESVRLGVRVLPKDVAEAFPDTASTVEALRLVMRLREVGRRRGTRAARARPR